MLINVRRLQVVLALLWLLDGALQLQPFMFTGGFARQVLLPAGVGQPAPIHLLVGWVVAVVLWHPAFMNVGFGLIELGLGVGLLCRSTVRPALIASAVWAAAVWLAGEGLGGLLTGAGLFAGAPGAALLYAVLAFAAWPTPAEDYGQRPASWLVVAWSALWIVLAAASLAGGHGWSILLGLSELAVAAGALRSGAWRWSAVVTGVALALAAWGVGQHFGGLATGQATDPGTGPLLVLMAAAVVSTSGSRARRPVVALRHRETSVSRPEPIAA